MRSRFFDNFVRRILPSLMSRKKISGAPGIFCLAGGVQRSCFGRSTACPAGLRFAIALRKALKAVNEVGLFWQSRQPSLNTEKIYDKVSEITIAIFCVGNTIIDIFSFTKGDSRTVHADLMNIDMLLNSSLIL